MGACASRPQDLNTEEAPLPVEKAEEQIVPQENKNEAEAIKEEEPLVDVSAPPPPALEAVSKPEEDSSKPEEVKSEAAKEDNDEEKKDEEDEVSKVTNKPVVPAPKAEETN